MHSELLTEIRAIGHEVFMPLSKATILSRRQKNPARACKPCKYDNLGPPRRQEQIVDSRDTRPVQREIEKSHPTIAGADEVGYTIVGSNPAEKGQRA